MLNPKKNGIGLTFLLTLFNELEELHIHVMSWAVVGKTANVVI